MRNEDCIFYIACKKKVCKPDFEDCKVYKNRINQLIKDEEEKDSTRDSHLEFEEPLTDLLYLI